MLWTFCGCFGLQEDSVPHMTQCMYFLFGHMVVDHICCQTLILAVPDGLLHVQTA